MTTEPNIEPLLTRVAQRTTTRETLGMAHEDWRRLGRCLAWCYLPMLILDSLLIFGISLGGSIIPKLLLLLFKLVALSLPIAAVAVYFGHLIEHVALRLPRFRHRLGLGMSPPTRADWLYRSRTFIALTVLYIPMLLMATELAQFGEKIVGSRAEPVIDAVEKYVAKHGTPPERVQDLVPDYITSIPTLVPGISVGKSRAINGYNPGYWYLTMELPTADLLSDQSLTYCSAGREGIFSERVVPCGRWMRCTSD